MGENGVDLLFKRCVDCRLATKNAFLHLIFETAQEGSKLIGRVFFAAVSGCLASCIFFRKLL